MAGSVRTTLEEMAAVILDARVEHGHDETAATAALLSQHCFVIAGLDPAIQTRAKGTNGLLSVTWGGLLD